MATYIFPSTLRQTVGGKGTPCVYFKNVSETGETYDIYLPIPVGFQVNDGAGWSNFDQGLIPVLDAGFQALKKGQDVTDAISKEIGQNGANSNKQSAAIIALMSKVANGGQAVNSLAQYNLNANKAALNPNTVLSYTNASIRSYSLTFRMVAESQDDSTKIKNILHAFRKTMYADIADTITLGYPDLWAFRFKLSDASTDNPYIPKPADCYITGMSQVTNPNGNAFHYDGAPAEVEFSLQMQEYRVLNRGDIEELENGSWVNEPNFGFNNEFEFEPVTGTLEDLERRRGGSGGLTPRAN